MILRERIKITHNAEKQSAQSLLMELAELRLKIHERVYYETEYAENDVKINEEGAVEDIDEPISPYEKFGCRTRRQLYRGCIDLFKDFIEKYIPITTNSEKIYIINENPWIRMIRYATADTENPDEFWQCINYAMTTYGYFLEEIREEQK